MGLRLPGLSQSEAKSLDQHYHRVSQTVQDSHLDKGKEGNLGNECMFVHACAIETATAMLVHIRCTTFTVLQTGSHIN